MLTPAIRSRIATTKAEFESLRHGKSDLLRLLDESELPESVYNSNAIENSTLTLEDTERILLAIEVSRHMDLREVHEAQNLARVTEYIRTNHDKQLELETILLLHKMLMSNIDDSIAGRFRNAGEYVRVGTHIAPAPEHIESLLVAMLIKLESEHEIHPIERIARVHLEFERIHPFNDGNGRIGRVLINYLLYRIGFPPVIVRNKGKLNYYKAIQQYDSTGKTSDFESQLSLLILESLNRRIAYLNGSRIISVADYARRHSIGLNATLSQARRQKIGAFRERGEWKIADT